MQENYTRASSSALLTMLKPLTMWITTNCGKFLETGEPEINLPTSVGSWRKQESSRKIFISALLTMPKLLTLWITINVENSERDGNTRPPELPPEKSVCRSGSNS